MGKLLCFCTITLLALVACRPAVPTASLETSRVTRSNGGAPAKQLFGAAHVGSAQSPQAFGSYAKGCQAGATQLPETGPTWQAMRLSRNRNWAHPETIEFVKRLSRRAARQDGWNGLYVGDMSQPRGGPMLTGHRSHQTGLDLDIWMRPADDLNLSVNAREAISSISTRRANGAYVNADWTRAHHEILKAAAKDPAVARIFVFPGAKVRMCEDAKGDRAWLRKIRPWWGHHYHFHIRLKCPDTSRSCIDQTDPPPGDGCDDARGWVRLILNPPPDDRTAPPPRPRRDLTLADLPKQCVSVLHSR
ncbi:MAG: penicillin-insensitive murein endopeptidase [Pseudomonadota bacterium]